MQIIEDQPGKSTPKQKNAKRDDKPTSQNKTNQKPKQEAASTEKKTHNASTKPSMETDSRKSSTKSSIPISDVTGSRGLFSRSNSKQESNKSIRASRPTSGTSGNRGLVSQNPVAAKSQNSEQDKAPHIPITVVTGSRDITTVSPELRAHLRKGSPSATTAIPDAFADLANVLEKAGTDIDWKGWRSKTSKQQLAIAQRAGLSQEDQRTLLNASPHYVETIARTQDVFANRYDLGITTEKARSIAKELFDIAQERDAAISRTGKYENDAVFAPKAMRWLDEKEEKILKDLQENTNETGQGTWYNGGNSEPEEDKETSADIHRRAKYADIDETAASKQIEELLLKNVKDAKRLSSLPGFNAGPFSALTTQFSWFLGQVSANKPMDYKNPAVWFKTLPGLPYPKEDKVYNVFGHQVSSSDLGNLNYAMVGRALGISEDMLLQQAGAAQLKDHKHYSFIESQNESMKQKNRGYGDEKDDQKMITNGFNLYNLLD